MKMKHTIHNMKEIILHSSFPVKASLCIMGTGQMMYRQWIKGFLYFSAFVGMLSYMIVFGFRDIIGFITLGSTKADPWLGIKGDDSVLMMLRGLITFLLIIGFLLLYASNIRDVLTLEKKVKVSHGKQLFSFKKAVKIFVDRKFYITALFIPIVGVLIFNIIPIVFMIIISFTNYGGDIVPPKLIDWVGLENFKKILSLGQIKDTFFRILSWNILWAFAATVLNYFGGLGLALLLNKKCVKGKRFWRAFPILSYAVPGFITLLAFKFMFSYGGPINHYITQAGGNAIGFLDIDAGIKAKLIGLFVNAWICIPTSMLLVTGILSNMNTDLYEAASIDGASKWKQFRSITLPFVIFSTTPVVITSFIGNFNNFGVFYYLRGGLYMDGYFLASDTDLLINWLYNLSIDNNYYAIGAAVSLIIFIITSIFSLGVYVKSAAFQKEDTFR